MSLKALDHNLHTRLYLMTSNMDHKNMRLVSKEWKEVIDKVVKALYPEFNKPNNLNKSDGEYFYKLHRFISYKGILFGQRGNNYALFYKELLRFGRELEKGEGFQPKTNYYMLACTSECAQMESKNDTTTTPLAYFKNLRPNVGFYCALSLNEVYEQIFHSLAHLKKAQNVSSNHPCLGESSFYNENGFSSTAEEKGKAVFGYLQKTFDKEVLKDC